jgi:hypothetical protein
MLLPLHIPASQSIQPFSDEYRNVLIFVFPKSKSEFANLAIQIAQSAKFYCESNIFNKIHYFAGFELTFNQAQSAFALLRYVGGWKGTHILINGIEKEVYSVEMTLSCILKSQLVEDSNKYCCSISNTFIQGDDTYWMHPCRIVLTQQHYYKIIPNNHLSIKDQLFTQAITSGCEWCPKLKLDNLKPVQITVTNKDI